MAKEETLGRALKPHSFAFLSFLRLRRGKIRRQKALLHFPAGCIAVARLLKEGDYEPEVAGEILSHLAHTPGAYLDIGAHVGLLSLPILRYRTNPVYSVEAIPELCEMMKKTRSRSPYTGRWHIHCAVIAPQSGRGTFYELPPAEAVYSGREETGRASTSARSTQRDCLALDELWDSWGRPKVAALKLDLEGGEIAALEGTPRMISSHRPVIFLEWQPKNFTNQGKAPSNPVSWATQHGYEVFRIPGGVPVTTFAGLQLASERTENYRLQPSS